MSDILRSRSFWTMVFTAVVGALALAVPEIDAYKEELIAALVILAGLIIGGFKAQDILMARNGLSRYSSYSSYSKNG